MSPLPFAPPPKDSSLYQQLESTTLQTLTADQLDTIRAKTFSQGTEGNEDEYRRLLLLGLAASQLSLSGPIPGTSEIASSGDMTGTSVTATIKTPAAGEVWQVCEAECKGTLGDTPRFRLYVEDSGGTECELGDITLSVSSTERFDGEKSYSPVYFDENTPLKCQLINGSSTTGTVECLIIRVR